MEALDKLTNALQSMMEGKKEEKRGGTTWLEGIV
jgi:hypothetical protein